MKVNRTSASHLLALAALFTLVYIIYLTGPNVNFSPKHKHRLLKRKTVIIADRPTNTKIINPVNFTSPLNDQLELTFGRSLSSPSAAQNLQNISECLCSRKWKYPPSKKYSQRLNSSCSDEGTHYQPLQKVISFSLWIPPSTPSISSYSKALLQNLLRMRHLYPGYSIRLYTSGSYGPPLLHPNNPFCSLLCQNPDLFWCSINITPSHGDLRSLHFHLWRYLPLGDPTVRIFHSRDLSSLISYREAAAVQHWLSDTNHKAIMVMRDRKIAHDAPMLGNLWGADNVKLGNDKGGTLREQIIWMGKQAMLKDKGGDHHQQVILEKVIFYPMAKFRDVVAYDSYNCVKWGRFTEVRAFPTQRQDPVADILQNNLDFGGRHGRKRNWTAERCPVECRPDYGKDWIYC